MNLRGEPAHVGRLCGSSSYAVTGEGVGFFSDTLDDRHPLYERWAPPLLFHSECYRFAPDWYLQNLVGNLHAQQDWEFHAPMEVGSQVKTRSMIVDRYSKRGRDYVVNETDVVAEADDRLLVRGRTYQSFVPSKATGLAPGGDKPKRTHPPFPTAEGRGLDSAELRVDDRRCWMFSGPERNYHTDRDEARKLGFPDIVVQGMLSTCLVSRVMQQEFGAGWITGGRMSVKLTSVVWVDELLRCHARVREAVAEGSRTRVHCDVWVEKEDGARSLIGTASAVEGS